MKRVFFILGLSFLGIISLYSQANISVKINAIGASPFEDVNRSLYTKSITNDSIFTFEPGIQFSGEIFGKKNTSLKIIQSYSRDQVGFHSGFTQALIRIKLGNGKKTAFHIGIGPAVHYRENWMLFSDYQDDGYNNAGSFQYKASWLSGEIEFNYNMKRNLDFSVSLNHLHPHSLGLFFGLKFWFDVKSNHCNTCPSYR